MASSWNLEVEDAKRLQKQRAQVEIEAQCMTKYEDVMTEVSFIEKSRRRKWGGIRAVEKYLRHDLPCGIEHCFTCYKRHLPASKPALNIIPDAMSLIQCVELQHAMHSIGCHVPMHFIVLQTIYQHALRMAPSREATNLKQLFRSSENSISHVSWHLFPDANHIETATSVEISEENDQFRMENASKRMERAVFKTLAWYKRHGNASLTYMHDANDDIVASTIHRDLQLPTTTCLSFIQKHITHPNDQAFLLEVVQHTTDAIQWFQEETQEHHGAFFAPHERSAVLEQLIASQQAFVGVLDVSSHHPMEAFVNIPHQTLDKIFVYGTSRMNRGIHGDQVVIRLLPEHEWLSPKSDRLLVHYAIEEEEDEDNEEDETKNAKVLGRVPTGEVIGVLERSTRSYVATILSTTVQAGDEYALAIPMDIRIPKVRIRSTRLDTLVDHRIKVVIDQWPIDSMYPNGHYVSVLGHTGVLETELSALLVQNEIDDAPFSEAALACLPMECDITAYQIHECSTAKRPKNVPLLDWSIPEIPHRRDIRSSHRVFSVDPPGCQDIDDAMSIDVLSNGNYELGVHIADVSFFVPHDSPLDHEARRRATTVYLVNQRLDMLPSVLSADVCSLHANVDRLAVSVFWEVDPQSLEILDTSFGRTIIRSCASMTYEQAHRLLQNQSADNSTKSCSDGRPGVAGGPIASELQPLLRKDLKLLTHIARKLARKRGEDGGLDLSKQEEVRFAVNVSELTGQPQDVEIIVKESLEIHNTIAELMILANAAVAQKIYSVFPLHALLRRHAPPSGDRFAQLIKMAQAKDIVIDATSNSTLQQSLVEAEKTGKCDTKTMALLKSLAVRVMTEAEYVCASSILMPSSALEQANQTTAFAHYGLGLQYYTHFTSPIRRYADVIVHRQLLQALCPPEQCIDPPANARGQLTGVTLPPSITPSVLEDEDDLLDQLTGSVETQLQVTEEEEVKQDHLVFPPDVLVPLSAHLNHKNRQAKNAARDCDELFLALYFSNHTLQLQAIITSLKQNGFIVYIPQYDLRAPVYLRDKDGNVQMDPLLCGVRIVDTKPPTGAFVNAECIRLIPQATIEYDATAERLQVQTPTGSCAFHMLDEVVVQVSCELTSGSNNARVPQLQVLLLGPVKKKSRQPPMMRLHPKAETSIPELQRIVQRHNTMQSSVHAISKPPSSPVGPSLYDKLQNHEFKCAEWTRKPKKKANTKVQMVRRCPGRMLFNGYDPPVRVYAQKLAHYMGERSEELEAEMNIQRTGESNSSMDLKRVERDAMSRTLKLAAEKRHDRINRRNKTN